MHTIWRRFVAPAVLRLLRDAHRHRVVGVPCRRREALAISHT